MQSVLQSAPARVLGFWTLCALVVGNMIGSGIFLLPTSLAAYGGLSIIGWLVASVGALLLAFVFANLSSFMPKEGGPYAYCRAAFGDLVGFQVAYNYWIAVVVANAAVIIAMVAYLTVFWPSLAKEPLNSFLIAASTVWIITAINLFGIRQAGITQLILTILKILPLVILIVVGCTHIHFEYFNIPSATNWGYLSSTAAAASLTIWAFTGLESATVPAAYAKHPHITIPRATVIGTLFTSIIYILCSVVVMGMIAPGVLKSNNAPFAVVADQLFGPIGGPLVAFSAALSCFSNAMGLTLLQGQVPMAVAQDGLFLKSFTRISKNGTPVIGLLFSSVFATIILAMNYEASLVEQFTILVKCSTLAFLIPYIYTAIAKLVLLMQHPLRFSGKNHTVITIVALAAFIFVFAVIIGLGEDLIYYGALLFFLSVPLYVWIKYRQDPKHDVVELDEGI